MSSPSREEQTGRRVLIVNLTRLGDLLQTSPTIAALRARDPSVHISVLADKNFSEVCAGIPGVDRTIRTDLDQLGKLVLAGGEGLVAAFESARGLVEELRAERFDLALNFSSSRMSAVFMRLLQIPEVRGWCATPDGHRLIAHPWSRLFATMCLNREMSDLNLVDHYRGIAGGGEGPRHLQFETTDEARERANALLGEDGGRRLVALQLGASRESRMWPQASFAKVGRELRTDGCRIALIGGPKEKALAEAVSTEIGDGVIDLCGRTDIATLAAVLERADLLVTGDTGPMHLAAAMRTPLVGLFFGPALPYDTGPYGPDHVLIHAAVACAPCAHSVTCLDAFCRLEISPEHVTAAARARLRSDWEELDRVAAGPGPVRFFRTSFDAHGLYQCQRLGGAPAEPEDALRSAYRAVWLAALEDQPLPQGRAGVPVDTTPFLSVAEMARRGMRVAGRLEASATQAAYSEIQSLGAELAQVDSSLERLAAVEPTVRPLAQMFRFGQESLDAGTVGDLAHANGALYRALEFEANAMTELLTEPRARG